MGVSELYAERTETTLNNLEELIERLLNEEIDIEEFRLFYENQEYKG